MDVRAYILDTVYTYTWNKFIRAARSAACELWVVGSGLWTLGVIFGVAINIVNIVVFDVP